MDPPNPINHASAEHFERLRDERFCYLHKDSKVTKLVSCISETFSKLGNIVEAVTRGLFLVLLGVVRSDQDALVGLDGAGTSVVALQVSSSLVIIIGSCDILDTVDSNSSWRLDLSTGGENWVI